MTKTALFLLLLAKLSDSSAQVLHDSKFQDKTFPSAQKCGLERFTVSTYDSEFVNFLGQEGRDRKTIMAATWETSDASCVRDYGIVQFIKGCIYNTKIKKATGEQRIVFEKQRENRGVGTGFIHKNWEVDSVDVDPLYSSNEKGTQAERHDWHRFAVNPLTLKNNSKSLAFDKKIFFNSDSFDYLMWAEKPVKQLFVTDLPSGSSYNPNAPLNEIDLRLSSLEFKTCIYHMKDIPRVEDPASFKASEAEGGPIHCFDWSDKMGFDHAKKNFYRTEKLDVNCGLVE